MRRGPGRIQLFEVFGHGRDFSSDVLRESPQAIQSFLDAGDLGFTLFAVAARGQAALDVLAQDARFLGSFDGPRNDGMERFGHKRALPFENGFE